MCTETLEQLQPMKWLNTESLYQMQAARTQGEKSCFKYSKLTPLCGIKNSRDIIIIHRRHLQLKIIHGGIQNNF
jgi:hypothetical protein